MNTQLIRKDRDAGKDWRQKEKRVAEDEMLDSIPDSMDMSLSKLQQMVTAAMKLKDACLLEEKLWPT